MKKPQAPKLNGRRRMAQAATATNGKADVLDRLELILESTRGNFRELAMSLSKGGKACGVATAANKMQTQLKADLLAHFSADDLAELLARKLTNSAIRVASQTSHIIDGIAQAMGRPV